LKEGVLENNWSFGLPKEYFSLDDHQATTKVCSLSAAIKENIRPEMNLYITPEGGAGICELLRQFRQFNPKFTITMAGITEHALNLVHCGLAKKLITSNCSHQYPGPRPSKVIQESLKKAVIEIENWTLFSLQQRLMAGALDLGFLPTKSILDSSMAEENANSFLELNDPFKEKGRIGLLKQLNPDLAIVHAWAADTDGNTIFAPTSSQVGTDRNMWGVKACKDGCIVTVEKIVSKAFIRQYSALVSIPGYLVKAVCEVPYGAHPQGLFSPIPDLFESYAADYDFVNEQAEVSRNKSGLDRWLSDWVFECRDHQDYVSKLGAKRILLLKAKAKPDYWKSQYQNSALEARNGQEANETEMLILTAYKLLVERILKRQHKILLGGVGISMLSAWMAFHKLRKMGYHIDLVLGSGPYGFVPPPSDPFYGNFNILHTCKAFFNTSEIYGFYIAGRGNRSISVFGGAQVDKHGNVNSTRIEETYLVGSGGANDAANATDAVLVIKQSRNKFVEKIPYITCKGTNIRLIISDMGVYEKPENGNEFLLEGCLAYSKEIQLDDRIKLIRQECGWDLRVADNVKEYNLISSEELTLLRSFDPERIILAN
jgi:acyl CoA:acetate/3-ketoacid CoA transferase alpha subunit/acyl CoA:acetate/3-ketoacid CoA transferase beta subunit